MKETFYVPRRSKSRTVYVVVIALLVIGGAILQFDWMQRARQAAGSGDIVSNPLAEKLGRWMLDKRGLSGPGAVGDLQAPGVEKIMCETCLGTGEAPGADGRPGICPICQGVGFRMIRRFDSADRLCPLCAGMGRVEMPDTGEVANCPRCDGRGLVRAASAAAAPEAP